MNETKLKQFKKINKIWLPIRVGKTPRYSVPPLLIPDFMGFVIPKYGLKYLPN